MGVPQQGQENLAEWEDIWASAAEPAHTAISIRKSFSMSNCREKNTESNQVLWTIVQSSVRVQVQPHYTSSCNSKTIGQNKVQALPFSPWLLHAVYKTVYITLNCILPFTFIFMGLRIHQKIYFI